LKISLVSPFLTEFFPFSFYYSICFFVVLLFRFSFIGFYLVFFSFLFCFPIKKNNTFYYKWNGAG
jgi:hypothetical protein